MLFFIGIMNMLHTRFFDNIKLKLFFNSYNVLRTIEGEDVSSSVPLAPPPVQTREVEGEPQPFPPPPLAPSRSAIINYATIEY